MPTDPKINEHRLLQCLRDESVGITPNQMRELCAAATLGAFDRKVEREFFIKMIDLNAAINTDLSALERAAHVRNYLTENDPGRSTAILDAAIEKRVHDFTSKRRALADMFYLISQCPTTGDTIS